MVSDWIEATVDDIKAPTPNALATGPFGSSISARFFEDHGVPVIRGSNLSEDVGQRLLHDDLVFVSAKKAKQFHRSIARRGDLVFTCWGTIGQVGLIDERCPYDEYVVSNKQMKLTPDPGRADSLFLYYLFSGPEVSGQIRNQAIGSSVPGFNLGQLRSIRFRLPPLPEQRAIAHILGTLDDKIELNRRMNETLEQMARAIFKSWFVDFDPVRARAEGRQPAGMDAETAALFPEGFEESELGEIPRGWRVAPIGDMATIVGGSTPRTDTAVFWDGTIHFCTPKDLANLTAPVLLDTERCITEAGLQQISSGLLPKGTLLLSSRAPIGYLAIAEIPVAVNQGFIAMVCNGELPNYYLLYWARQNMDTIVANANGTTFLEISKKNFRPIPVVVPSEKVVAAFVGIVQPLHERVVNNLKESRTLAAIRDALLPKLMSGEIRVRDAGRVAGETV